eukprot:385595_1
MGKLNNNKQIICATCYDKWIEKGKPMKSDKPAIKWKMSIRSLPDHCKTMNAPPGPNDKKVKYPHPNGNVSTTQMTENTYYYHIDCKTGLKQTKSQFSFAFKMSSASKSKPKAIKASKFAPKPKEKQSPPPIPPNPLIEALYGLNIWIFLSSSGQISFSRTCTTA